MPPQRLPIVDSDDGVWGDILRQYLMKEHYNDDTDNAENGGHKTITIRAGTATAGTAPLKFTTGTLLSSPEAGAVEFVGDNLYVTQTSGTTRKKVALYDDSSGATGDIYYRDSSGYFTRLGVGGSGDLLNVSSGIPAWTSTIAQSKVTNLTTDLAAKAADSAVVHTTGNESIAGTKTFTDRPTVEHIEVIPASVGGSASMFLNNNNGQTWEFFGNNGGSFGVYDQTNSKQPFTIDPNTPSDAFKLATTENSMQLQLNMNSHKIVNVTDPTSAQDAATKAYVDSGTATLTNKTISGSSNTLTNIPQEQIFSATNLLTTNPSFASNISGWTAVGGAWSHDSGTGHTANGSATTTLSGTNRDFESTVVSVTPGETYFFGIWVKGSSMTGAGNGHITLELRLYNGASPVGYFTLTGGFFNDGSKEWHRITDPQGTFDWTYLYGQGTVPASGVDGVALSVWVPDGVTGGTIWVDDAFVGIPTIHPSWVKGLGASLESTASVVQTLNNKTLNNTNAATLLDSNFTLQDNVDATKQAKFEASGITAGQTRTLTIPDASTTLVGTNTTQTLTDKTLTNPIIGQINDTNGNELLILSSTASAVNEIKIINAVTGISPAVAASGNDTNISVELTPKGSGRVKSGGVNIPTISSVDTLTNKTLTDPKISGSLWDTNNNEVLTLSPIASAVNHLNIVNAATGSMPAIYATGSDANIGMWIQAKGTGSIWLGDGDGNTIFIASRAASAVNYLEAKNAATGNAPSITAWGSDTNVNLDLVTKGSGVVKANNVDVATISGTQTLTNKTLTDPRVNTIKDTNGASIVDFGASASAVNYFEITNRATGAPPYIAMVGSDTNIDMGLIPKGTGRVQIWKTTGAVELNAGGGDTNVDMNLTTQGAGKVKGPWVPRINSTASSATPSINTNTTDQFNITALAAAITSMTTNLTGTPSDGQKLVIRIKDDGTARAITWGASWQASDQAALITTTVVGKTHQLGFIYDSVVAKWICVAAVTY